MATNIIQFGAALVLPLNYGVSGEVSKHRASNSSSMIGKLINLSVILAVLSGLGISLILGSLKTPLFYLYNAKGNIEKLATNYFFFELIGLPFNIGQMITAAIWFGLRKPYVPLLLNLFFIGLDMLASFLLITKFHMGMQYLAICWSIANVLIFISSVTLLYLPSNRKLYKLSEFDISLALIKSFSSDSSVLLLKGILAVLMYLANPITASSISPASLSAMTILNNLYFYIPILSNGVNSATVVKASHYIGTRMYSKLRYLAFIMPMFLISCACIVIIIYATLKTTILNSFTKDPDVINEASSSWIIMLLKIFCAAPIGAFEGMALARRWYVFQFFVTLISVGVGYVPLLVTTIIIFKTLFMIQVSNLAPILLRAIITASRIYYQTWTEFNLDDDHDKEDTKGHSPLLINDDQLEESYNEEIIEVE